MLIVNVSLTIIINYKIQLALRLAVLQVLIITGGMLFIVIHILCSLSKAAHSSYLPLNLIMANNKIKVNIHIKCKILTLIEKLTKPKIGFTCLDTFTFADLQIFIIIADIAALLLIILNNLPRDIS